MSAKRASLPPHVVEAEIQVPRYRTVRTEQANGWSETREVAGYIPYAVRLTIDVETLLRRLGTKAAGSKRRVSKGMSGAIVAKVLA